MPARPPTLRRRLAAATALAVLLSTAGVDAAEPHVGRVLSGPRAIPVAVVAETATPPANDVETPLVPTGYFAPGPPAAAPPANGSPLHEVALGYDDGFVLAGGRRAGDDPNEMHVEESAFLLRVNSWVQLRYMNFVSTGPNPSASNFSLERARVTLGGHAFTPAFRYFVQLDGGTDRESETVFLDYFIKYDVGRDRFGWRPQRLGLQAGKWKIPFNESRQESGWRLQFADRSMASLFFDINRSTGVALYGYLGDNPRTLGYETSLFNGFNTGGTATGRSGELDRNFTYATRVFSEFGSEWGSGGLADLTCHCSPTFRIGAGLAFSQIDNEGNSEFMRLRVADSGESLASILPAGVTQYEVNLYSINAQLKFRGFSLHYEYYLRTVTDFEGAAVDDLFDHGFWLQSGYMIVPGTLELLGRWSRVQGDSGTLGAFDQSSDEVAGGIAWYFDGQRSKLVFDATHVNGSPVSSRRLDLLPGDAGWLYRVQWQVRF